MADAAQYADPDEEIWENQVPGRTYVEVRNFDGSSRQISVVGVGSRLRLRTSDRVRVQERLPRASGDPFRNGTLVRIDKSQQEDPDTASTDALSMNELEATFQLDLDDFREYVETLGEVNLRRLKDLAPQIDASLNQTAFLNELIEKRYPNTSGDTKTYRDMMAGPRD